MRCDNIEISMKIPVPINRPDGNGITYTEEAIINSCKDIKDIPIVQFDKDGEKTVIGIAKHVVYKDGYILVDGISWHGGTGEKILSLNDGMITSMEINNFGLTV